MRNEYPKTSEEQPAVVVDADTETDSRPISDDSKPPTDAGNKATDTRSDDDAKPEQGVDSQDANKGKARMELFDWMQCIVSAVICGIFVFVFIGRTIGVEGHSMLQTLQSNDRVIVSGLFYKPKNNDIIIFRPPTNAFGNTPLVKRIIAVGGQTIDIDFDSGDVTVDGVILDEPYINAPTLNRLNFSGPVTVPDGYVFVMGDNRNNSSDSRDSRVGMVDTRYIIGKVLFLMIPGAEGSSPRDWSRFGLVNR